MALSAHWVHVIGQEFYDYASGNQPRFSYQYYAG